jgi:hypothetical protein
VSGRKNVNRGRKSFFRQHKESADHFVLQLIVCRHHGKRPKQAGKLEDADYG